MQRKSRRCSQDIYFCHYTLCMALRLLAATTSQGKLRDFRIAAHAYSLFIDPLPAADTIPVPEEDGETFQPMPH